MKKNKIWMLMSAMVCGITMSVTGCAKDEKETAVTTVVQTTETAAEIVTETTVEVIKEMTAAQNRTLAAEGEEAPDRWLTDGDENDDYYTQTCEWPDYPFVAGHAGEYIDKRIAFTLRISAELADGYYGIDADGNEVYFYDNRNQITDQVYVDDIVDVYGEFKGIGNAVWNKTKVGTQDFVLDARVIRRNTWITGFPDSSRMVQPEDQNRMGIVSAETREMLDEMLPVFDSLLLACEKTDKQLYDPKNTEYFWEAMYQMMIHYGGLHPLTTYEQNYIQMPRMAAQEFATVMFYDYDDLPLDAIKGCDSLNYDADWDALQAIYSDREENATRILEYYDNGNGDYAVTAELFNTKTGESIWTGVFEVKANPYADGIENPLFDYTVVSAEIW